MDMFQQGIDQSIQQSFGFGHHQNDRRNRLRSIDTDDVNCNTNIAAVVVTPHNRAVMIIDDDDDDVVVSNDSNNNINNKNDSKNNINNKGRRRRHAKTNNDKGNNMSMKRKQHEDTSSYGEEKADPCFSRCSKKKRTENKRKTKSSELQQQRRSSTSSMTTNTTTTPNQRTILTPAEKEIYKHQVEVRGKEYSILTGYISTDGQTLHDPVASYQPTASSPPKRPLSAYNLYFHLQRQHILNKITSPATASNSDVIMDTNVVVEYTVKDVVEFAKEQRKAHAADMAMTDDSSNDQHADQALSSSSDYAFPNNKKRKHRKTHGMISFTELARCVAIRWKQMSLEQKCIFHGYFAIEMDYFKQRFDIYDQYIEEHRHEISKGDVQTSHDVVVKKEAAVKMMEEQQQKEKKCVTEEKMKKPKVSRRQQHAMTKKVSSLSSDTTSTEEDNNSKIPSSTMSSSIASSDNNTMKMKASSYTSSRRVSMDYRSSSSSTTTLSTNGMIMKGEEQEVIDDDDHKSQFVLALRLEQQRRLLRRQQEELQQLEQEEEMMSSSSTGFNGPAYPNVAAAKMTPASNSCSSNDWDWKKKQLLMQAQHQQFQQQQQVAMMTAQQRLRVQQQQQKPHAMNMVDEAFHLACNTLLPTLHDDFNVDENDYDDDEEEDEYLLQQQCGDDQHEQQVLPPASYQQLPIHSMMTPSSLHMMQEQLSLKNQLQRQRQELHQQRMMMMKYSNHQQTMMMDESCDAATCISHSTMGGSSLRKLQNCNMKNHQLSRPSTIHVDNGFHNNDMNDYDDQSMNHSIRSQGTNSMTKQQDTPENDDKLNQLQQVLLVQQKQIMEQQNRMNRMMKMMMEQKEEKKPKHIRTKLSFTSFDHDDSFDNTDDVDHHDDNEWNIGGMVNDDGDMLLTLKDSPIKEFGNGNEFVINNEKDPKRTISTSEASTTSDYDCFNDINKMNNNINTMMMDQTGVVDVPLNPPLMSSFNNIDTSMMGIFGDTNEFSNDCNDDDGMMNPNQFDDDRYIMPY